MAFASAFSRPVSPPIWSAGAAAANQWWLSGGISASNAIAAYQPKGAASQAASYTNLANPGTNNAAPGTAPTWDTTNGWIFNGTSQYLTTGIVMTANWSGIVRFSGATTTASLRCPLGAETNATGFPRWGIYQVHSGSPFMRYDYGSGGATSLVGPRASGVHAMTGAYGYYNATRDSAALGAFGTANTTAAFIGAASNSGSPFRYYVGNIQAIAIYNISLSDAQISALTTAMNLL